MNRRASTAIIAILLLAAGCSSGPSARSTLVDALEAAPGYRAYRMEVVEHGPRLLRCFPPQGRFAAVVVPEEQRAVVHVGRADDAVMWFSADSVIVRAGALGANPTPDTWTVRLGDAALAEQFAELAGPSVVALLARPGDDPTDQARALLDQAETVGVERIASALRRFDVVVDPDGEQASFELTLDAEGRLQRIVAPSRVGRAGYTIDYSTAAASSIEDGVALMATRAATPDDLAAIDNGPGACVTVGP